MNPSPLLAATAASTQTFATIVASLSTFVSSSVTPALFALAFIFFLIGVVRYFFSENDENREKGRQFVLWSVIAFVVLFSLWSIVKLFLALLTS